MYDPHKSMSSWEGRIMNPKFMNILINVTRDDIDNGIRKSAQICPIALAVRREVRKILGEPDLVEVDGGVRITTNGREYVHTRTYKELDEFIARFDVEDYVAPFQLAIELEELVEEDEDEYTENNEYEDKEDEIKE